MQWLPEEKCGALSKDMKGVGKWYISKPLYAISPSRKKAKEGELNSKGSQTPQQKK
jgi:hypothetical protein